MLCIKKPGNVMLKLRDSHHYYSQTDEKMNSISEECLVHKQKYDACFNSWFKDKFLKGVKGDSCAGIFKAYQQCVKVRINNREINLLSLTTLSTLVLISVVLTLWASSFTPRCLSLNECVYEDLNGKK